MSISRLMTIGVYGLGGLMIVLGLLFVVMGVPIVRMEIGWTEVIGGAVVASAGCVVVVLGLFLSHLEAILETLDRVVTAGVPVAAPAAEAVVMRPTFDEALAAKPAETRPQHPLAPPPRREMPAAEVVSPLAPSQPLEVRPSAAVVRPEPALTAALHPAEQEGVAPAPVLSAHRHEPMLVESAPALTHAEDEAVAHGPRVVAPDAVDEPLADATAARGRSAFLSSFLSRRLMNAGASRTGMPEPVAPPLDLDRTLPTLRDPDAAEPGRRLSLGTAWDDDEAGEAEMTAQVAPSAADETQEPSVIHLPDERIDPSEAPEAQPHEAEPVVAPPKVEAPAPHQPVVVGRYNAGAASYVMYSNGMIEVETDQGKHQFASMQELKAFIEKRDMRVS